MRPKFSEVAQGKCFPYGTTAPKENTSGTKHRLRCRVPLALKRVPLAKLLTFVIYTAAVVTIAANWGNPRNEPYMTIPESEVTR